MEIFAGLRKIPWEDKNETESIKSGEPLSQFWHRVLRANSRLGVWLESKQTQGRVAAVWASALRKDGGENWASIFAFQARISKPFYGILPEPFLAFVAGGKSNPPSPWRQDDL